MPGGIYSVGTDEPDWKVNGKQRCLVELCGLLPGARVLDVMCGVGELTPYLLEWEPARILGVDASPEKIAKAAAVCPDERVEFRCCDFMGLGGEEFDCAVVNNAYHLVENRGSLIRQMHHLLADNGRLMICQSQSRHMVNNSEISIPLPAAKTLANTISQYFEIDTMVDSTAIYLVSGIKKRL